MLTDLQSQQLVTELSCTVLSEYGLTAEEPNELLLSAPEEAMALCVPYKKDDEEGERKNKFPYFDMFLPSMQRAHNYLGTFHHAYMQGAPLLSICKCKGFNDNVYAYILQQLGDISVQLSRGSDDYSVCPIDVVIAPSDGLFMTTILLLQLRQRGFKQINVDLVDMKHSYITERQHVEREEEQKSLLAAYGYKDNHSINYQGDYLKIREYVEGVSRLIQMRSFLAKYNIAVNFLKNVDNYKVVEWISGTLNKPLQKTNSRGISVQQLTSDVTPDAETVHANISIYGTYQDYNKVLSFFSKRSAEPKKLSVIIDAIEVDTEKEQINNQLKAIVNNSFYSLYTERTLNAEHCSVNVKVVVNEYKTFTFSEQNFIDESKASAAISRP